MVEFKIVKVEPPNCAALNDAAKEGFSFVEWVPCHPTDTVFFALVAKDEEAVARRNDLNEIGDTMMQLAAQYFASLPKPDPAEPPPPAPAPAPEANPAEASPVAEP